MTALALPLRGPCWVAGLSDDLRLAAKEAWSPEDNIRQFPALRGARGAPVDPVRHGVERLRAAPEVAPRNGRYKGPGRPRMSDLDPRHSAHVTGCSQIIDDEVRKRGRA